MHSFKSQRKMQAIKGIKLLLFFICTVLRMGGSETKSLKVFKKTSPNSVLTLYLGSRDLVSRNGTVEPLRGVIYIDPKFICNQKIYGQLTLTFRYGREDEEVMGLKFCNEAVIAIKQIWPRVSYNENEVTPLQQALTDRLGPGAHPFSLEIGTTAPPSVQLVPAKKYCGAPIGTSYDIRIYMSDVSDEKFFRRTTVKLGIRLLHKIQQDLRIIQQINPTYTSLPKSIRLRLSPKQLKFYQNKTNSAAALTTQTTSSTTTTISCANEHSNEKGNETTASTATINFNCISSLSANNQTKNKDMTSKLLAATTTTAFKTIASTTNTGAPTVKNNSNNGRTDDIMVVDEKGNTHPGNGIGVSSGLTIRLPTAPTAAANVDTHPLTLNSLSFVSATSSTSASPFSKEYAKPMVLDPNECNLRKIEVAKANMVGKTKGYSDKSFSWNEGRVSLSASLNKSAYKHGENVCVSLQIINNSKKVVRKLRVFAVQHVDVCMFSNGKFKNVIADVNEAHQIKPNDSYDCTYNLVPIKGSTKNWIAVEGSYSQGNSIGESPTNSLYKLASSVHRGPSVGDRNVFAIYVSYYVKVKLTLSGMGGEVALKLPFTLGYVEGDNCSHSCSCNTSDDDDVDENKDIANVQNTKPYEKSVCTCDNRRTIDDIGDSEQSIDGDCDSQATTASLSIIYESSCGRDEKNSENCSYKCVCHEKTNTGGNTIADAFENNHERLKATVCMSCTNYSNKFYKNIKIEEELSEKCDKNDLFNRCLSSEDSQDNDGDLMQQQSRLQENEAQLNKERNILHNIKLKRSSYSRSCEDIEAFTKLDNCKFVSGDCSWTGPTDIHLMSSSNADSIGTDE